MNARDITSATRTNPTLTVCHALRWATPITAREACEIIGYLSGLIVRSTDIDQRARDKTSEWLNASCDVLVPHEQSPESLAQAWSEHLVEMAQSDARCGL